jgi:hypothetical protein
MKPNEWAAIVFGLLGFVISCITLARSVRSDAKTRALSQRQERQDLLVLLMEARLSLTADLRRWEQVGMSIEPQDRVNVEVGDEEDPTIKAMIVGINEGIEQIEKTIKGGVEPLKKGLDGIERARSELVKELPKKYSEELAGALSGGRLFLTEVANTRLIEEEHGRLLDAVKKALEKARETRTTLEHVRQAKKDALSKRDGR